jgi:hypothetical protein
MSEQPTGKRVSDLTLSESLSDEDLILLTVVKNEAFASKTVTVSDLKKMLHIDNMQAFHSDDMQFVFPSKDGSVAFALDNDFGAWFADLPRPLQEYLKRIMPTAEANQYPDYHEVFLSEDKTLLRATDGNGGLLLCGLDDPVQDSLGMILPRRISNGISGWQDVFLSKDKKLLRGMDENGGLWLAGLDRPVQDILDDVTGDSGPKIVPEDGSYVLMWGARKVWGDRPVLSADKVTSTGAIIRYLPAGEAKSGTGVIFHRGGREMPVEAAALRIIAFVGQSLNVASDAGNIPDPNSYNKVNRDPALRGRAITVNNGKPEFSSDADTIISDDNLDKLADMVNAKYRQGHVIPLTNRLIYDCDAANLPPSIFYSANSASGGKAFSEIMKGTVPYTNGLRMVQRGTDIAAGIGKPCSVDFILIAHGETDNGNGTNTAPGAYYNRMTPYLGGYARDCIAITGQVHAPLMVIDQLGSRINTQRGTVDEEGNVIDPEVLFNYSISSTDQWDYVQANPDSAIMPGSKWPLNWATSDGSLSHLNNWGKVLQGEYLEQALFWSLNPANITLWQPTHVKSIQVEGRTITATWHPHEGALVRDVDTFGACPGDGFSLENGSANVVSVTQSGNQVVIEFDAVPATDDALLIGFTNIAPAPNGEIYPLVPWRDSSTRVSLWYKPDGVTPYPLYNWGILQRIPLEANV